MQDSPLKRYLARQIAETSQRAVAKRLGVDRRALANYLLGCAKLRSGAVIMAKAEHLGWPPESDEDAL